ncbi:protein trichome birefringence-like 41 [Hibiscus syriacus]|uniref:protein trichome birefringence-like 41 n=1 Tax=Hibiscus syriacus TaxID=106335 RepID=UPI0019219B33|nr:protein trichome birefringence-like 41 [Hibiscus syriacus]
MGSGFPRSCWIILSWILILCIHQVRLSEPQAAGGCDYFRGTWVFDQTYPLYNTSDCPFIEKEFDCQANGRPDQLYLRYRWKPSVCMLPRFNAEEFFRKLKGKKIMFIGDSLSLNQWQSLTCMLHSSLPQSNYTIHREGQLSTFYLPEYEVSLMLSRNAFLVDIVEEKMGTVLKLDSIKNGESWKGYDFLIFNTWHWWLHKGRKQPWDFIESRGKVMKDMDRMVAYREGLTTWSKWVDSNVNTTTTQVFFQGISPTHFNGEEWNGTKSLTCKGQIRPATDSTYEGGPPTAVTIINEMLKNMSTPVVLLDITRLSQLRKDGHPSIYSGLMGNDCSHWCLAGVPDTWNQILYAILTYRGT